MIFIIFTGVNLIWTVMFLHKRKEIDYAYFSNLSENRNQLYEIINGMPDITQHRRVSEYEQLRNKINKLSLKSTIVRLYMDGGATMISRLRDILIMGICSTMVVNGDMTLGIMMTVTYVTGRLSAPFSTLISSINDIQDASISFERLDEILSYESTAPLGRRPEENCDISLENISFKYPGSSNPLVIKDFSVVIPQGKITAIVGSTGCGKSTLLKLIIGLYHPKQGRILAGSQPLEDIDIDMWIQRCGIVMQDGYIFSGSIAQNISIGETNPDIKLIRKAARIACIDEFIMQYPMGYSTRIGPTGVQLSGGQRQRLLLARAVYKDPSILVLDEATSSLDAVTEHQIVENLAKYGMGRTVIIAAHRLSTIQKADNIIFMKDGMVVEQGPHEYLYNKGAEYYRLVEAQLQLA